ncbi:MAG: bifunctional acetaldehyde-CoA/alcohol dehydrogenase [Bifidobacterium scardovii]|uniref:bifunctional acetaldehyde-CoA/alcohol dehydrogenase n=2 Tax=Bifidobacterium scardovii TaxID=158787 RepID=UPI0006686EC0|nr:bifunctional acetaldehyde-CoA/alcohol dehydrogenase [Bifidobacterium scardovii]MDU5297276.1 bifunctional acetaldehyde-CoA/alcohol dehydrogenase [Bifidobacterium scardovii]MDU5611186.1 bifunctional acetaldehyde-CoA/alcohol dehydrogenase [Bifidobacterium scardovii]MDU5888156.1 bifunctional acetaldehyde-CoA/alcohol dehydrogenase [Bifidobacterium scardovii]
MAEATKAEAPTKPSPEEKQAAAEAEVDALVKKGLKALDEFEKLDQKQVDRIVAKASIAALNKHLVLAKMAVDETGRGLVEDKATKNIFACEHVTNYLAGQKTVGIIREDDVMGIDEIAEPVGVVAGVTPVTNPTSTAIFKSLIALKTRCPIIFGFHPGAQKCSVEAARIVRDAAIEAGAPENCIQWIEHPSIQATGALMKHPGVATILATGGPGMVKAAYSSGKPALGVGAGNAPAYVDKNVDIVRAANDLVLSKHFDYGMICATEQAIIADKDIYAPLVKELKRRKAYFVNADEKAKLERYMFGVTAYESPDQHTVLNSVVPGKSPQYIAKAAGFEIPSDATILIAECKEVGEMEPLTMEKLAPVQALLKSDNKEQAFEMCEQMLVHGAGHTAAIHTNDEALVREYGQRMHACRIIWNSPSSLGGVGDIYNAIAPSLTLGCGSYGGNSVSGNVQAVNLLNIKRIARRNNNMQWFKIPAKTYFEPNAIKYLRDMYGIEKAVIVCDKVMEQLGIVDKVIDQLRARANRVTFRIIDYVEPEPSVEIVERGAEMMREEFEPDTIIAVGGGSPMDAAKIMWLLYEHPEIAFSDVREKFFDIRKRAFKIPPLGKKAKLVCIPTSSGTGSEVTPFAVISDHKTGYKYPITDYALTPSVAIVDPVLARPQPRRLASDAGFDALTHSMEAYVSVYANDFTDGMALHAAKLVWENLAESVNGEPGEEKTRAQEKMHNAATMAGMAFGSAFLGMCHGMSHTIGALCHIAHGRTNSILLPYVIRYNGQVPEEPTSWPKYSKYIADERYRDLAINLGVDPGKTPAEAVENLAKAVEDYRDNKLGMNKSFKDCGVDEDYFWSVLDQIGMRAYEDQCAPANPRIPQIEDMKDIAIAAYYGVSQAEGRAMRIEREGVDATEEASERV